MKKFLVLAITVATMAWAVPASAAEPILFDPTGADPGGTVIGTTFDWKPGNSLLLEDTNPDLITPTNPLGLTGFGTVYFQANLNSVLEGDENSDSVFTSGTDATYPGEYFTAVAGYRVQIIPLAPTVNSFEVVQLDGTNFFNIYHNTTSASNLTGTCFVCNDDLLGDPILSAEVTAADAVFFDSLFAIGNAPVAPLDQFVTDNYPGVLTLSGIGVTTIRVTVTDFDPNFFPSLTVGTSFVTTNTNQISPFDQADPSACFDSNGEFDGGGADCDVAGAWSVNINGTQSRVIVQSDANSSFDVPDTITAVPEPTTLSLLGLGLLLGGAHLRRRAKKNA